MGKIIKQKVGLSSDVREGREGRVGLFQVKLSVCVTYGTSFICSGTTPGFVTQKKAYRSPRKSSLTYMVNDVNMHRSLVLTIALALYLTQGT